MAQLQCVVVPTQLTIPIRESGVPRAKRLVVLLGVDGSVRCNARDVVRHVLGLPAETGNHASILAVTRKLAKHSIRDATLLRHYNGACGARAQSNPIVQDHDDVVGWLKANLKSYVGAEELLSTDRLAGWVDAVKQVSWLMACSGDVGWAGCVGGCVQPVRACTADIVPDT
jgi:hypothetical protein